MFALTRPCNECPFRKAGGVRVTKARAREIAGYFIDGRGGTFPCHKTSSKDDERECERCEGSGTEEIETSGPAGTMTRTCSDCDGDGIVKEFRADWELCAGGMLFADKLGTMSTMMQLGVRLGLMKLDTLQDRDQVFDSLDEMIAASDEW